MSEPIGTDERLDRIEELEAKLAQQADLVQAAVAAKLREAANACVNEYLDDPQGTKSDTAYQHAVADCVTAVLALIPEGAQAALDRVVAAERGRIADLERRLKLWVPQNISETGRWPIREGGE